MEKGIIIDTIFRHILMASALFLSPAPAGSRTPYKGSRIFWDTSTQKKVFQNGGYARMTQLKDGRLMAVTENNGIDIAFSTDLGNTWSPQTKIVSNKAALPECVPDLIQLSDGTILVGYNPRPSEPYSEDRKFGIRVKRSTDNGATWEDETYVVDADYKFDNGCWEPSFLQLPSGEVHLYYADEHPYTTNNDQQISLCRSFDNGRTWSEPEKVSYRAGRRDGMPSAVILNDGNIAMAYEDNGWPGFEGSFLPTISVCPLDTDWHDYWTDADSPNRWKACDYDFVNQGLRGGAPCLRVLPWGETVLSHQSDYGNDDGRFNMYVYVGDEHAKGFKAACAPFSPGQGEEALWNSLAVVDTGVVVAVAPISGRVEMMKGYPVRLIRAPYGSPAVDGVQTRGEGYCKGMADQVILGRERGTRFTADFSYDGDSLYFTSRVSDRDQAAIPGSYGDGVTLYMDTRYVSSEHPEAGMFRFFFRLDGTMQAKVGDGKRWAPGEEMPGVNFKVGRERNYYVVETAIPWPRLGFESAPLGRMMRVNVEMQNRGTDDDTTVYEMLPDARRDASWTWMDFALLGDPRGDGIPAAGKRAADMVVKDGCVSVPREDVAEMTVYATDGHPAATARDRNAVRLPPGAKGVFVVKVSLKGGGTFTRKIRM